MTLLGRSWRGPRAVFLTSLDTITVVGDGSGSVVTYDAELTLNGPLRLADPLLGLSFKRIGDRAAAGLIRALDGERVTDPHRMSLRDVADAVIEAPVVTSFTRIGYESRKRLDHWTPLDGYDLTGQVIVLTGATSGLGKAAANQLARCGAGLVLVGRNAERNEAVVAEMIEATGNDAITQVAADLGDYDQVRALADAVLSEHDRVDVLIHNAGALTSERHDAPDGTEATVASQVVGPFLLTSLLLDRLAESAPSRVLTMSSGGMYSAGLTVSGLQMDAADYKGTEQYARAKRAQVTLNEMWAERFGHLGIHFHAMHPGWADTPGVDAALPASPRSWARSCAPLTREPTPSSGSLPLTRRSNPTGCSGSTAGLAAPTSCRAPRGPTTPSGESRLWSWVSETCGVEPRIRFR